MPEMSTGVGENRTDTDPAPRLPGDLGEREPAAKEVSTPMFTCYGCLMQFPALSTEQGDFCADCTRAMPAYARRV